MCTIVCVQCVYICSLSYSGIPQDASNNFDNNFIWILAEGHGKTVSMSQDSTSLSSLEAAQQQVFDALKHLESALQKRVQIQAENGEHSAALPGGVKALHALTVKIDDTLTVLDQVLEVTAPQDAAMSGATTSKASTSGDASPPASAGEQA